MDQAPPAAARTWLGSVVLVTCPLGPLPHAARGLTAVLARFGPAGGDSQETRTTVTGVTSTAHPKSNRQPLTSRGTRANDPLEQERDRGARRRAHLTASGRTSSSRAVGLLRGPAGTTPLCPTTPQKSSPPSPPNSRMSSGRSSDTGLSSPRSNSPFPIGAARLLDRRAGETRHGR
jgi:hypothetical protein